MDVETKLDQASALHQVGQFSRAEQIYQQILVDNPQNVEPLYLLGVIAHQVGKHEEAVDLITRAIEKDSHRVEASMKFQKFVPSFLASSKENKPLFFNHIEKTGGTTLTGILASITVCWGKQYRFINIEYGLGLQPIPPEIKQDMISELRHGNVMAIAGHSHYGFHLNFGTAFNLVTVVRNPIERVVSEYFWKCRHNNRWNDISQEDFAVHLKQEESRNVCAKYVSGQNGFDNKGKILDRCKQNLERYFAFCTTENLDRMASFILTRYGSGSVVFNDSKKETDPRKHKFKEQFEDQIIKLNEVDYSLYRYVKEKESRFFLTQQEMLNINTNVVSIKNKYQKSFTIGLPTSLLLMTALRRLEW